jgi:hypothetical protein
MLAGGFGNLSAMSIVFRSLAVELSFWNISNLCSVSTYYKCFLHSSKQIKRLNLPIVPPLSYSSQVSWHESSLQLLIQSKESQAEGADSLVCAVFHSCDPPWGCYKHTLNTRKVNLWNPCPIHAISFLTVNRVTAHRHTSHMTEVFLRWLKIAKPTIRSWILINIGM